MPFTALPLDAEQSKVLELAVEGYNIFFTGSAGTSKSRLLVSLVCQLHIKYPEVGSVAVTATTGLAASTIGGVTLHKFASIGLGRTSVDMLVKLIMRNTSAKLRWEQTKVIIIDEVSMLDGKILDKLDLIAQRVRPNTRPFGEIQLIFSGDFFHYRINLEQIHDSSQVFLMTVLAELGKQCVADWVREFMATHPPKR